MFIRIIPQGHCVVVERFGKPVRVVHAGLRFFIPILDHCKNVSTIWEQTHKQGTLIELTEQIFDTRPREYFTKDNVRLEVNCVYRWRIIDPIKAIYEVDHLHKSLQETVLNEIRSAVGARELNSVLSGRSEISEEIVAGVSETVRRWGVSLIGAEIQELKADNATMDAMRIQMEASRRSEAFKLESQGKAEAMKRMAEAEKEAAVLRAEGERTAMELIANGDMAYVKVLGETVGIEIAAKILLAQKSLQTYTVVSGNSANKVFMPPPAAASLLMFDQTGK